MSENDSGADRQQVCYCFCFEASATLLLGGVQANHWGSSGSGNRARPYLQPRLAISDDRLHVLLHGSSGRPCSPPPDQRILPRHYPFLRFFRPPLDPAIPCLGAIRSSNSAIMAAKKRPREISRCTCLRCRHSSLPSDWHQLVRTARRS